MANGGGSLVSSWPQTQLHRHGSRANGNLLVGKAYTGLLDLNRRDEFELKLGPSQIPPVPVGSEESDED